MGAAREGNEADQMTPMLGRSQDASSKTTLDLLAPMGQAFSHKLKASGAAAESESSMLRGGYARRPGGARGGAAALRGKINRALTGITEAEGLCDGLEVCVALRVTVGVRVDVLLSVLDGDCVCVRV
jgi:hypothetical protein